MKKGSEKKAGKKRGKKGGALKSTESDSSALPVKGETSSLLAAFVVNLGWFLCVLNRSWVDLLGFGRVRGTFWRSQGCIFQGFLVPTSLSCKKPLMRKNRHFSEVFLCFLHIAILSHKPQNDIKSVEEPVEHSFPQRLC